MKIDFKLYKTFDADLISLIFHGVSVSSLLRTAVYNYVRGIPTRFYTPECRGFNMENRRRTVHVVLFIEDPESVSFLRSKLKFRQRAAFLRTLLRDSMVVQQFGPFLNKEWIDREALRVQNMRPPDGIEYEEVLFGTERRANLAEESIGDDAKKEKNSDRPDRFGEVADLALPESEKKRLSEKFLPEPEERKNDDISEDELPLMKIEGKINKDEDEGDVSATLDEDLFDSMFNNIKNG